MGCGCGAFIYCSKDIIYLVTKLCFAYLFRVAHMQKKDSLFSLSICAKVFM